MLGSDGDFRRLVRYNTSEKMNIAHYRITGKLGEGAWAKSDGPAIPS
jgi:hypothetical protein